MVNKTIQEVREIKQYIIKIDDIEHKFKTINEIEDFFKISHGTAFNIIKGKKKTINIKKTDGKLKIKNI